MVPAAAIFVGFLLSNMASPVYPLWQDELGYSAAFTTVIFSGYPAGVFVGLLGLGRLIYRIGWARALAAALACCVIGASIFAAAPGPWWLLAARFVSGVAAGICASCGAAAVTESFERRGSRAGPSVAGLSISAGLACGPLLGGIFADLPLWPTQLIFVMEAALAAVIGVLVITMTRSGGPASPRHHDGHARIPDDTPADPVRRRQVLTAACALAFSSGITCAIYMSIGSGFLRDTLGTTSTTAAGLLVFLVFASAVSGQLLFARASWTAQGGTALAVGAIAAAALVVGVATSTAWVLFVSASFSGAAQGLAQIAGLSMVRSVTNLARLRGGYALFNAASYLGGGGSVLVAGGLLTFTAMDTTIVILAVSVGVLTAMSAVMLATLVRTRDQSGTSMSIPDARSEHSTSRTS